MKSGKSKKNSTAPLSTGKSKIAPLKRKTDAARATVKGKRVVQGRIETLPPPTLKKRKTPAPKNKAVAMQSKAPVGEKRVSEKSPASAPEDSIPELASLAPVRPSIPGPPEPPPPRVRERRPVPVEIPPILLEPDYLPAEPVIAGPEARFAAKPEPEPTVPSAPEDLPESYGTEQIFLVARDPYCLFASWDLNAKQRVSYNAESASGALTIRLRRDAENGPIHLEVHTSPEARDWFIEAKQPETTFVAELGYHEKNSGAWKTISTSKPATTPRDRVAPPPPRTEEPSPIPAMAVPEPQRDEVIFAVAPEPEPHWIVTREPEPEPRWEAKEEPQPIRERPQWEPPKEKPRWKAPKPAPRPKWTEEQTKALDELISLEFRRMQHGSVEIEELLRRRILRAGEREGAPSSMELLEGSGEEFLAEALGLAQPGGPSSLETAATASGSEKAKGFWFRVNAELIIYGSTEPDAHVSIGGRPIRLRSDGSFSYRFVLPDGEYELPVIALSRDGDDGRAAELRFARATQYLGEVETHPQDKALKAPIAVNL